MVSVKIVPKHMDSDMLRKMHTTYICPRLEYAAAVPCPHLRNHLELLEKVQRNAKRMEEESSGMR